LQFYVVNSCIRGIKTGVDTIKTGVDTIKPAIDTIKPGISCVKAGTNVLNIVLNIAKKPEHGSDVCLSGFVVIAGSRELSNIVAVHFVSLSIGFSSPSHEPDPG